MIIMFEISFSFRQTFQYSNKKNPVYVDDIAILNGYDQN